MIEEYKKYILNILNHLKIHLTLSLIPVIPLSLLQTFSILIQQMDNRDEIAIEGTISWIRIIDPHISIDCQHDYIA